LQKSNKPTRDQNKKPIDPFLIFNRQVKMMLRGNNDFFEQLKKNEYLKLSSKIFCTDARTVPVKDESVDLIITSPPYVTSYEYADLHQLTAL
jgi:tRNA G10  N-methylase Trm11